MTACTPTGGAVIKQAELLGAEGQYFGATTLLDQLLGHSDFSDFDEAALTLYMELTERAGGLELALKAYGRFTNRLREELKLEPTPALAALAERIRTGHDPATASARPGKLCGVASNDLGHLNGEFDGALDIGFTPLPAPLRPRLSVVIWNSPRQRPCSLNPSAEY